MNIDNNIKNKKIELSDFFENHKIPYKKYFNKENKDSITFIKLDNNIKFNNKISDEMNYAICTLFKKNINKESNTVLFYFCGYDDCFYHPHMFNYKDDFDIMVIDIPGFGFNKKYTNNYNDSKCFNYYDNINNLNKSLDIVFNNIYNIVQQYDTKILFGHSTGGNILINYVYYLENEKKEKNKINFNKLILNSPLTRFAFPNFILKFFFKLVVNTLTFFNIKDFDTNAIVNGTNKTIDFDFTNQILNNVNNTTNNDYNYIYPYKSKIYASKLTGLFWCVEKYNNYIINKLNGKHLKINCKSVCSTKYGNHGYGLGDVVLNPEYIKEDVDKIFGKNKVKSFSCIHDCMLEPTNDENDEDILNKNTSYLDILDYLLN